MLTPLTPELSISELQAKSVAPVLTPVLAPGKEMLRKSNPRIGIANKIWKRIWLIYPNFGHTLGACDALLANAGVPHGGSIVTHGEKNVLHGEKLVSGVSTGVSTGATSGVSNAVLNPTENQVVKLQVRRVLATFFYSIILKRI